VLKTLEVDIERTRNEILRELDPQFSSGQGAEGTPVPGAAAARKSRRAATTTRKRSKPRP